MKSICVVGLGYIGLPTSIFFADKGYNVHGFDVNTKIITSLQNNQLHIDEPGLLEKYQEVTSKGRLTFSTNPVNASTFIIAVPTPITKNKTANLTYVKSALKSIIPYIEEGTLIVLESTVPPRTINDVVIPLIQESGFNPASDEVFVAYCPERVIPGNILLELNENDRIAGGYTQESANRAAQLFGPNIQGTVHKTTALTAEMTKLMENTYRDVNIALANELTLISEQIGVNTLEVIDLANKHPRVNIHQPGPGVGGHCIPVDPYFIIEKAHEYTPLIRTARKINETMPLNVINKINQLSKKHSIENIAVLGLSYKGNVSDIRESPSIEIVNELLDSGYTVKSHDSYVKIEDVDFQLYSLQESLEAADLALVLVDHHDYKELTEDVFAPMNNKVIFDTKNCIQSLKNIKVYRLGD